jgi:hypothetical protein
MSSRGLFATPISLTRIVASTKGYTYGLRGVVHRSRPILYIAPRKPNPRQLSHRVVRRTG